MPRAYREVMSSEGRVAKFHAPEILFGFGALPEAATAAMGLGARRPLVVTDPWLELTPWPGTVVDGLRARGATLADAVARRAPAEQVGAGQEHRRGGEGDGTKRSKVHSRAP